MTFTVSITTKSIRFLWLSPVPSLLIRIKLYKIAVRFYYSINYSMALTVLCWVPPPVRWRTGKLRVDIHLHTWWWMGRFSRNLRLLENFCEELVNQIFRIPDKIMATVVILRMEGRTSERRVREEVLIFLHFVKNERNAVNIPIQTVRLSQKVVS